MLANADQYSSVSSVYGDLSIKPMPVTVTVPDASKVYGEADPAFEDGKLPEDLANKFREELEDADLSVERTNDDEDAGEYADVLTTGQTADNNRHCALDIAVFNVKNSITLCCHLTVVGYQHNGNASLLADADKFLLELTTGNFVYGTEGFIHQEYFWICS